MVLAHTIGICHPAYTAKAVAGLAANRTSAGKAVAWPETVIEAQAHDLGLKVATRNTQDFPEVPTINPWNQAGGPQALTPGESRDQPPATEKAPAR